MNPDVVKTVVATVVPAIVSLIGLILVNVFNSRNFRYQREKDRQTFQYQQTEDERKEVRERLNSFYGPLQVLLGKSGRLYRQFTQGKPDSFRTLLALLDGTDFQGNDKALLEEILQVTGEMELLITKNSGLISDREMRALLVQAAAHFTYMRLAYKKELRGSAERFKTSVYPRTLNEKIDAEVLRLEQRLDELTPTAN